MPKFLPPQDILKGPALESCVSVPIPLLFVHQNQQILLKKADQLVFRIPSSYIILTKYL